jgi:2-keto-3-deoxy-L-rhamnonate aldolase RhmA
MHAQCRADVQHADPHQFIQARASRWNQVDHYLHQADGEMFVAVGVDTALLVRSARALAKEFGGTVPAAPSASR